MRALIALYPACSTLIAEGTGTVGVSAGAGVIHGGGRSPITDEEIFVLVMNRKGVGRMRVPGMHAASRRPLGHPRHPEPRPCPLP